jgi:formylglycine-generating enzyme required for sulfatase activity
MIIRYLLDENMDVMLRKALLFNPYQGCFFSVKRKRRVGRAKRNPPNLGNNKKVKRRISMRKQYYLIYLAILSLLLNSCVSPELMPSPVNIAEPVKIEENVKNEIVEPVDSEMQNPKSSPVGETKPIKQRFALLIGNQEYQKGRLDTSHHDVDDMEKSLKAVGFKVRKLKDQNLGEMKQAIVGFGELLTRDENTVGLFYFSGHGMQYQGKNFLFPIGAMLSVTMPEHLPLETLNAEYLLATMKGAGNQLNLVFLDTCRDHSFAKGWAKGPERPGLAPMQAPSGSLIAYATGANRPALAISEGERNSPYTRYLKEGILKPGMSIFEMLTQVRVAVKKETGDFQEPDFYSGLDGTFCFKGPCGQVAQVSTPPSIPISIASQQPGTIFRDRLLDGSLGPEMVVIPAGRFRMGDIQGGGYSNEQPVHEVSVAQFAIGRYEVTFAEYDKFAQATGRQKPDDEGWGRDNRPVINVSWFDVMAYAKWLSQQTGQNYRLPTEAEWEYAARAGSNTKYWWGNDIGSNQANCLNSECGDHFEYTAPVGSFAANAFGLYDTVGNVWEWTCSVYEDRYQGAEQRCASGGSLFALRGGSWGDDAGWSRAAYRNRLEPTFRLDNQGARLARQ